MHDRSGRRDAVRLTAPRWLDAGRAGQVLFLAGTLAITVYFFCLTSPSLHVYFTPDDVMNLHRSWISPAGQLVKANLLFFLTSDFIRPMGSVWYRAIFHFAGFNAFWFHAANLAILLVNIFLTYAVTRRLSASREIGAVAALLGSYTTRLAFLYFDTGYIYDVLCYLFFFAAFLFYLRVRQQKRLPKAWEVAVFCGLYVCALNSKEMAVTLPVFLAIYEVLYHLPRTRAPAGLSRWALRVGRTTLITSAITLVFLAGRSLGSEAQALIASPAYRPLFTWTRFMATSRHFMGDITNTGDWSAWSVLALWALLFAVAWYARSRTLKFAWLFLMLSPLPVAFIPGRGASQYYISWFAWVLYGATLLVGILKFVTGRVWPEGPRLSQVRGTLLFAVLMLTSYPLYKRKGWENVGSSWTEAPANRDTVAQLHKAAPQIRSKSKLLFLNDPIRPDWWNLDFLVHLSYHDRSLEVTRAKQMKEMPDEKAMASYDYVLDYDGERFIVVKRP